jgi:hypothetical protein
MGPVDDGCRVFRFGGCIVVAGVVIPRVVAAATAATAAPTTVAAAASALALLQDSTSWPVSWRARPWPFPIPTVES